MSNERILVQLTITVDYEGKPCVKVDAPSAGSPTPGGSALPGCVPSAPSVACIAQRTVHIVAGNGGLAWFTLIWPAAEVITTYNPNFAYDILGKAGHVPDTGSDHPLYARKVGARVVWDGIGKHSQPTVFVAGINQTHTANPDTTTVAGGPEVIAAGAVVQLGLAAPVPVISFKEGLHYGPVSGAPAPTVVQNAEGAIGAIRNVMPLSTAVEQELRPSPAKLESWGIGAATPKSLVDLANNLLFTANAFRLGLVSTVLMPAFNDDPHGAFNDIASTTARADTLARVLDGFYTELALHVEPKCSLVGTPLSLADNVVLVVSGDTPKSSFNRHGWSDGTPGGSNLLYVRSNGYLKPGWFGNISPNGRVNFDPATGLLSTTTSPAASTSAAQLGILFAINRGDAVAVGNASPAPYAGVIASSTP